MLKFFYSSSSPPSLIPPQPPPPPPPSSSTSSTFLPSKHFLYSHQKQISTLRIIVLICLAAIAGGGSYIVFKFLQLSEFHICISQFRSVADFIHISIHSSYESKIKLGRNIAREIGNACPDSAVWPYCSVDPNVYQYLALPMDGNIHVSGFAPFVSPEDAHDFEEFSKSYYNTSSYPKTTGYSSFGFGIFAVNLSDSSYDHRYHDVSGIAPYGSPHKIIVPIILVNDVPTNYVVALYNLHSERARGVAIDHLLNFKNSSRLTSQSSLTSIIQAIHDSNEIRTTAIYTPIYPRLNRSVMVGISAVYLYWDTILTFPVPSTFPEIIIVVETDTAVISYSIDNGRVKPLGNGDQHDPNFDNLGESQVFLSKYVNNQSAPYRITVYPTRSFCEYYYTTGPLIVALGLASMMIITALIFGFYDYFMRSESLLRKFLLESKRLFVRFISHELRTPMNAIILGLALVEEDLKAMLYNPNHSKVLPNDVRNSLIDCIHSLQDADENANSAIVILNDMLQYDTIETKSLQCECIENRMWDIIRSTCNEQFLQAKACQIHLKVNLQVDLKETNEKWEGYPLDSYSRCKFAVLIGDPIKVGQVVRNLVSNAIKFSPAGSEVIVNGDWIINGLPDAPMPICSEPYQRCGSVRIEVIDNGPGISKNAKDFLFNEGVQISPNELQSGQGSGLGLWIARGITTLHGGVIGVDCDGPQQGCRFFVELPLVEGITDLQESEKPLRTWKWRDPRNNLTQQARKIFLLDRIPPRKKVQVVPVTSTRNSVDAFSPKSTSISVKVPKFNHSNSLELPPNRSSLQILIVDDAKSNCKLLHRALTNQGHVCDIASHGEECITLVKQKSLNLENQCFYQLILMDSEMPIMNGPTATKIIRSMLFQPQPIILGVTGNVLPEDVDIFLQHGVDAVLGKPLNLETMWSEYDRIIHENMEKKS